MAPMHPWIREGVEAGLLRFIVSCAVKYARGPQMEGTNIYGELNWIMKTILAQSLVWEVQSSPEMEEFTQVPLFSVWTTLATLVEQCAGVLNSWKSAMWKYQGKARLKALCILHKHLLLTAPPTANGRIGSQVTGKFANLLNNTTLIGSNSFDKQFHRNERAFMHALIDADYKRLKLQISRDIISFMQGHPHSPDTYLVHFDYTHHTGVKVTVQARPAVPEPFSLYRNRRLHVVFVAFGVGPMPQYILPLRESSTTFNAALHRIAEEIPAEADELWVENKVRELMQSTEEVVEIHEATARRNQGPAGETDTLEEPGREKLGSRC
ncbi:hypothetical protein B0H13DRAFT_1883532 [Mycena leptocephala]|nr:hypothetical protein B0H13DRAFT_1883532 [Mycena leptocephala]